MKNFMLISAALVLSSNIFASTPLKCFDISEGTLVKYLCAEKYKEVQIPEGVTGIGEGAFSRNNLTSVVIPNSVTEIGIAAFLNNKLSSVVIPESVTEIGNGAFAGNQLTSVVIPGSVRKVGNMAFFNNKLTSVIISEGVEEIGVRAFSLNDNLNFVTIPGTVTQIGYMAFGINNADDVNDLKSVLVPSCEVAPKDVFDPEVIRIFKSDIGEEVCPD
jgi:hypothetical protein